MFALLWREKFVGSRLKLVAHVAGGALKLVADVACCMLCVAYEGRHVFSGAVE